MQVGNIEYLSFRTPEETLQTRRNWKVKVKYYEEILENKQNKIKQNTLYVQK